MLFTNLTQWAVLALMLLVGWLFGFASNGGAKRWRKAYDDERAHHARTRDEAAAQVNAANERAAAAERAATQRAAPVAATAAMPAGLPPHR